MPRRCVASGDLRRTMGGCGSLPSTATSKACQRLRVQQLLLLLVVLVAAAPAPGQPSMAPLRLQKLMRRRPPLSLRALMWRPWHHRRHHQLHPARIRMARSRGHPPCPHLVLGPELAAQNQPATASGGASCCGNGAAQVVSMCAWDSWPVPCDASATSKGGWSGT